MNNFIWCYRKSCKFYMYAGKDGKGEFGDCRKKEVVIDGNSKCESEEIAREDKIFDMLREKQDYIDEVKRAGVKVD